MLLVLQTAAVAYEVIFCCASVFLSFVSLLFVFGFVAVFCLVTFSLGGTRHLFFLLYLFERSEFLIDKCKKKKTDSLCGCPDVRICFGFSVEKLSWF